MIEARGEASYTVPIVVPPGPAGHQPNLTLVYNSGEGKGAAGWLGFGWTLLGESRIERDTRTGSPYDPDNETCSNSSGPTMCYRDVFALDGQDLICDGASCTPCPLGSPGPSCRYRTQNDDGRFIYYFGPTNGWAIKDRDGRTLVYGSSSATQLVNPMNGQVFSWQLSSSTDVNSNVISYQYDTTSDANVVYLQQISYGAGTAGDRTVQFVLSAAGVRPDQPINVRPGFFQQMTRRVASIVVSASGSPVTRYDLQYTQDPDSSRSYLASVQRFGNDGTSSLPAYTFEYSERVNGAGFSSTAQTFTSSSSTCATFGGPDIWTPATNVAGTVFGDLVDVNRDGLVDIYQVGFSLTTAEITSAALGNGSVFSSRSGVSSCDVESTNGTVWSTKRLLDLGQAAPGYASEWSGLTDVDGDGYIDHLYLGDGVMPYTSYPLGVRRGGPNGFIDQALGSTLSQSLFQNSWGNPPLFAIKETASTGGNTFQDGGTFSWQKLIDVTGDGRPDLVMTYFVVDAAAAPLYTYQGPDSSWDNYLGWAVFVNRGKKSGPNGDYIDFGTVPLHFYVPITSPTSADSMFNFAWGGVIDVQDVTGISTAMLVDVNGDGILDRILTYSAVEYGTGAGFLPMQAVTQNFPAEQGLAYTDQYGCTKWTAIDLNGDGFLDRVQAGASAGAPWSVYFGNGSGLSPSPVSYGFDSTGEASINLCTNAPELIQLVDANGDGLPDHFYGSTVKINMGALPVPGSPASDPSLPSAALSGLLLRATDPMGGAVEFTYQTAPQMKDANGNPDNPGFSIPRPIVTRVRYLDGRAAGVASPPIVTTYHYSGGVYDYAEKEFRGFAQVTATLVETGQTPTTVVTTRDSTDRTCAFAVTEQDTSSGASLIRREISHYTEATGGAGVPQQWGICLPLDRTVESIEGGASPERVTRTTWDSYDASYNVTQRTDWGEWNLSANSNIAGDERVTIDSYAIPSSGFPSIVSRVRTEQIQDLAHNVYSSRQLCYTTACDAAASTGQVVAVHELLVDPTQNISKTVSSSSIVYDGYGNPTQTTGAPTTDDPIGLQTTIGYDATYHTFPILVSKGSDPSTALTTTLSYTGCSGPPALGLACSVTEPGSQTTNSQYDAFGRLTQLSRPASGYLENRVYNLPNIAGAGQTILETHQVQSGKPDLVYKSFLDGLGRAYREESPGKSSETIVVARAFDSRGRMQTESLPYFSNASPLNRIYAYDAIGRLEAVADPDGTTTRMLTYTTPWMVIDETYFGSNRQERKESSSDGLGRLVRVANYADPTSTANPFVVTASYDPADRLLEVRDPIANNSALCSLSNAPYQCQSQTHVTDLIWDTMGRRVQINDADSGTWNFQYDDAGLLKQRIQSSGGSTRSQSYTYDLLQRVLTRSFSPTGNGSANVAYTYQTTAQGSSSYGKLQTVSSSTTSYTYGYDSAARLASIVQTTAGKSFTSIFAYDALDRLSAHKFPDLELFDYGYDGLRLTTISGDTTNAVYKTSVLQSAGYDALGRISSLAIGQSSGGAPVASVAYTYDPVSARLTHMVGTPGNFTTQDPDGDGWGVAVDKCPYEYSLTNVDSGGVGSGSNADGIGNACQCGDVNGSGRVMDDDALAIAALGFDGTPLPHPELCDVNGDGLCDLNDYYAIEAALSSPPGDLQHCPAALPSNVPSSNPIDLYTTFDGLGRLTTQTGTLGSEPVNRSFAYDGLSRLVRAVGPWEKPTGGPSSVTWTYTYDALGNLQSQTSANGTDSRGWTYADPARPHFLTRFTQQNQWVEDQGATPFGEPGSITRNTALGFTDTLSWNAQGKLYQDVNSTYSYDAFDQSTLVQTSKGSLSTSIVRVGDDFEYDTTAFRGDKYFSVGGVRIAELATVYTANSASVPPALEWVLREATPLGAPVAALGLVIGLGSLAGIALRKRPPAWAAAPGVSLLAVVLVALPYEAAASTSASRGPGSFGRPAEAFLAYITDHLGSVRAVVNQNGIVLETHDYDPFGGDISHQGVFNDQHRFTGQPADDQMRGYYNYGARFYSPHYGRFLSPDEDIQGLDSQGLNPFAYVLNDPVALTDSTGHGAEWGVCASCWSTYIQDYLSNQETSSGSSPPSGAYDAPVKLHGIDRYLAEEIEAEAKAEGLHATPIDTSPDTPAETSQGTPAPAAVAVGEVAGGGAGEVAGGGAGAETAVNVGLGVGLSALGALAALATLVVIATIPNSASAEDAFSIRLQAQGHEIERSVSMMSPTPIPAANALEALEELRSMLPKRELAIRERAFQQARGFIMEAAAVNGVSAPLRRSFTGRGGGRERVDIEVLRGVNLVPGPLQFIPMKRTIER